VVRRGEVEALRALAARGYVGVSNTWGAKGVFAWDSPHHLGTVGLQARDYEMGRFADAALIVGVGIDEDESPRARWALAPTVQIAPDQLRALTAAWPRPPQTEIPLPPLFAALSEVCMPSYQAPQVPLHPGRAIIETKGALGPGDRVAADPGGELGMWVARAFPTSELGSVVVPATFAPDFAVTAAVACALRPEPQRVLAITQQPDSAVLEWARGRGVAPTVVVWGDTGDIAEPADVGPAIARGGVVRLPVDMSRTAELLAVAGPIIAWT
jgi:thiamine pyrophosphate-dependent acetolactate synthase large subunit-like protein